MRRACLIIAITTCWLPFALMGQTADRIDARAPNFLPMPAFPADGIVHILPSTMPENSTIGDSRGNQWMQRGFSLKALIAHVYRLDEARVEFADVAQAATRYDVAVALPQAESQEAIDERVKEALRSTLKLSIVPEDRQTEVEVVTSPQGPGPQMRAAGRAGGTGIGASGLSLETIGPSDKTTSPQEQMRWLAGNVRADTVTSGSLSVGGPVAFFCQELERMMDRPVVDETGLSGVYDISLNWQKLNREGFFHLLRQELGLVVMPGRRSVAIVTVRAS